MSKRPTFKVSDKLVKLRDGESYSLSNYKEGVDYVIRGCFKGHKAVFRSDILLGDVPASSMLPPMSSVSVEVSDTGIRLESQEPDSEFAAMQRATLELDEKGLRIVFPEQPREDVQPEEWRGNTEQAISTQDVEECKIVKVYPNFKWVETDKGRVWVGLKGANMKSGMIIKVKNKELYLGKTGPSGNMVRI